MPPKKKETKAEEPTFVDEVCSYAHEAEGARYHGGVRRYPVGADAPTTTTNGAAAAGGAKKTAAGGGSTDESAEGSAATAVVYRHGTGTYSSPTLHYTGEWQHDKMEGQGCLRFLRPAPAAAAGPSPPSLPALAAGDAGGAEEVYEGSFHEGLYEGQGRYQWRDGSTYVGSWRQGAMHGEGTFTDAEGRAYKGKFCMGAGPGLSRLYARSTM